MKNTVQLQRLVAGLLGVSAEQVAIKSTTAETVSGTVYTRGRFKLITGEKSMTTEREALRAHCPHCSDVLFYQSPMTEGQRLDVHNRLVHKVPPPTPRCKQCHDDAMRGEEFCLACRMRLDAEWRAVRNKTANDSWSLKQDGLGFTLSVGGVQSARIHYRPVAEQVIREHEAYPKLVEILEQALVEAEVSTVLWQQSRGFVGTVVDAYQKRLMPDAFVRARQLLKELGEIGES